MAFLKTNRTYSGRFANKYGIKWVDAVRSNSPQGFLLMQTPAFV